MEYITPFVVWLVIMGAWAVALKVIHKRINAMQFQFTVTKGRDIETCTAHTTEGIKRLADIYYSYGWNISEIFNTKTCRVIKAQHHHIKEAI